MPLNFKRDCEHLRATSRRQAASRRERRRFVAHARALRELLRPIAGDLGPRIGGDADAVKRIAMLGRLNASQTRFWTQDGQTPTPPRSTLPGAAYALAQAIALAQVVAALAGGSPLTRARARTHARVKKI